MNWIADRATRIGDMHPRKALRVHVNSDNDIVLSIVMDERDAAPIGNAFGDENASIEFCSTSGGGGRSNNTRIALGALLIAIKKDNEEHPIYTTPERPQDSS